MSSNLTSTYTIDLQIQDDNSKDAIRAIEKGFKEVGDIAKKAAKGTDLAKSLEETQNAAEKMIRQIGELSKDRARSPGNTHGSTKSSRNSGLFTTTSPNVAGTVWRWPSKSASSRNKSTNSGLNGLETR